MLPRVCVCVWREFFNNNFLLKFTIVLCVYKLFFILMKYFYSERVKNYSLPQEEEYCIHESIFSGVRWCSAQRHEADFVLENKRRASQTIVYCVWRAAILETMHTLHLTPLSSHGSNFSSASRIFCSVCSDSLFFFGEIPSALHSPSVILSLSPSLPAFSFFYCSQCLFHFPI